MIYNIEMTYLATTVVSVKANDEGDALEKARTIAEECDMNEYSLRNELESRIISTE